MTDIPNCCDLLIRNVHLATMNPDTDMAEDERYGTLHHGAVLVDNGVIVWLGKETELPRNITATKTINGQQQWLTPGLIDCHTHLVYAGDRSREFEQRLEGVSYETIARQGGGIISTVNATRSVSEKQLVELARPRLEALIAEGVTTVEIKSGYGLNTETELKILRAAGRLAEEYPVTVVRTFLGAHTIPPEFSDNPDQYVDLICKEMLPAIAKEQLAEAVDVFCESIAFTIEQTERVFETAKKLGLAVKLHAEQLTDSKGTELAVKHKALSVDHLEYLSDQGISALKNSNTVATLLPGAFYCLRETQLPPIDKLRSHGIPMAIATDLNPGTSPIASLRLIMHQACTLFRLTPAEALAGCTRHAAKALGLEHHRGMIKTGMAASLVLWPVSHPAALAANLTGIQPSVITHNGQITKSNMPIITNPDIWSGRTDQESNPELALRWHQKVKTYTRDNSKQGAAFVGFASDEGVRRNKGRTGAVKSPNLIRKAIASLPWNRTTPVWDAGTITCTGTHLEKAQTEYARRLTDVLENGVMPIGLGGGHEIAWGSYQGLIQFLERQHSSPADIKLGIINFDAHFDLRLPENGASSGTPFWQISEYAREQGIPFHYLCLGVSHSSNTRALFQRADELGVIYRDDHQMTLLNLDKLTRDMQAFLESVDYIYLTIDLDAFPAGQAPGVSAPAPRGVPLEVAEPLLQQIRDSGKILMLDVAELNPEYDTDSLTARLAARLIHGLAKE